MRSRFAKFLLLVIVILGLAAVALHSGRGMKARDTFYINRHCCDLSVLTALKVTIGQELSGTKYPSQIGQDKWVLFRMFPAVSDGFFLDVGSGDGTIGSNSKALEARGWKGICVDPFPTNMEDRTCQTFKEVVWSIPGHVVQFHVHGEIGGVAETLGLWKKDALEGPAVEFHTVTLGDILERGHAPSYIQFMSLDIEGAELEALRGLPFDKYRFGAMAIEHNEEEPKRTDILKFLDAHGYHRVFSRLQDDFFAPKDRQ